MLLFRLLTRKCCRINHSHKCTHTEMYIDNPLFAFLFIRVVALLLLLSLTLAHVVAESVHILESLRAVQTPELVVSCVITAHMFAQVCCSAHALLAVRTVVRVFSAVPVFMVAQTLQ